MKPIRVLVVDDSAFARKIVREVLTSGMEVVGIARDGLEALEKIAELKPDVITLDLVMPNLDGLGVLAALPIDGPRVVVVSMAGEDSALGIAALHAGAIDLVHFPLPVAIVLHLPPGYTQSFARNGAVVQCVLDPLPADTPHRPAVDVLFESAAKAYGPRVLGVVLTGMGDDATRGARAIHAAGGELLTESESSCVVYGMPRCVVEAGLSAASVRVDMMAAEIVRHL
jgi:chemotaxis response regulator CheB